MAEQFGFRVCVDAGEMRNDIKRRFYIYVDLQRDRCIYDIENRIANFLSVNNPISLMIGGIYLPSSENVRLLRFGDVLKVVEQNKECSKNKEDVNFQHKDGDSDNEQTYLKEHKTKRRRKHISGDINDGSCDTVKDKVQKCETLPISMEECAEYSKNRSKKRKKKCEDNSSCMLDEQYVMEESEREELLDGAQHLVEEQREWKMGKKKGNDGYVKVDDISGSTVSVTRALEEVKMGPETTVRGNQENGILDSIKMDVLADTVPDNESSLMMDTSTKRPRRRTRRSKKKHKLEQNETKRELTANVGNCRKGTFIQSIAAACTHIRFADQDGGMNANSALNDTVEAKVECEPVSVGLSALQPVVTSTDVCAASSETNGQEFQEPKNFVSHEGSPSKWDLQGVGISQSNDLVCSRSSCNNDTFAELLSFENFTVPRVYQRKKSSVTTDSIVNGTTSDTLPNTDVENRGQIKTDVKCINFSQFPIIKDIPKEGDIIAFKLLKMGNDYTPQISDYIKAKVLSSCMETYQLMLKVLGGHEQFEQPKGKFDLEDDDTPEKCVVDDLEVNWNEILETRLIFP